MGIEKFGFVTFTGESKVGEFVDFLEKGEFKGTKCKNCGAFYFPPRADCYKCLSQDMEWEDMEREGELITFTKCMYAPIGFEKDLPYILAIVRMKNGMRVFGRISKELGDDIEVGMKVKVRPFKTEEGRVCYEFVKA